MTKTLRTKTLTLPNDTCQSTLAFQGTMPAVYRHLGHNFAHVSEPSTPPSPMLPPPMPPDLPPAEPPNAPPFLALHSSPQALQIIIALLLVAIVVICCLCVIPLFCVRDKAYLNRLCAGRASCLTNIVCCQAVLCYNAFNIYMRPCLASYVGSLVDGVLCLPFRLVCPACCCRHSDKKFPAKPSSIGTWDGKSFADDEIEWVRARELLEGATAAASTATAEEGKAKNAHGRVKLFEDSIDPRDVSQGAVGDCWLIAAFAAAAEHPGLLMRLFQSKRANVRGKYNVKLFDWQAKRWVVVSVDESLPATSKGGKALFAQPRGREIWVALLEKAFAKFVGSYGALDGGQTAWAMNALTGDPVFVLQKRAAASGEGGEGGGSSWERCDMRAKMDEKNKRAVELVGRSPPESHSSADLFFLLRRYAAQKALMGASFGSYGGGGGEGLNGEDMGPQGLVSGHGEWACGVMCGVFVRPFCALLLS